jgi:hypothetical protein
MEGGIMEIAYARLPRPQKVLELGKAKVPTKAALLREADTTRLPKISESPILLLGNTEPTVDRLSRSTNVLETPMLTDPTFDRQSRTQSMEGEDARSLTQGSLVTLGTLKQNNVKWILRAQQGQSGLIMVKTRKAQTARTEQDILKSLNHQHIAKLIHSLFHEDGSISLAIEYCRYTLAEILFVHLKLEDLQLQYIARSVCLSQYFQDYLTIAAGLFGNRISRCAAHIS